MLDIGVGAGRTGYTFAPLVQRYVGLDYSPQMVAWARRLLGALPPSPRRPRTQASSRLRDVLGFAQDFRYAWDVRQSNRLLDLDTARRQGWTIVRDVAHDFSVQLYYVDPAEQLRQLAEVGLEATKVFDAAGRESTRCSRAWTRGFLICVRSVPSEASLQQNPWQAALSGSRESERRQAGSGVSSGLTRLSLVESEQLDRESWARNHIHWQHKGLGHRGWVWIAQIKVDGLIFEGRAEGPSKPGQAHAVPLKRRAEDAAVSDYMDFVRRSLST